MKTNQEIRGGEPAKIERKRDIRKEIKNIKLTIIGILGEGSCFF